MSRSRAAFWSVLQIVCSLTALSWVLWRTPLHDIEAVMARASLPLVLGGMGLNVLTRLVASERTHMVCRGLGLRISRWQNIETLFISSFYALLSPGPVLSGAVSVYRYSRLGVPVSEGFGVLLLSRAIEAAVYVSIGAGCLWADPRVPLDAVRLPLMAATAFLLLLVLALLLWARIHTKHASTAVTETNGVINSLAQKLMKPLRAIWNELVKRGPAVAFQAAVPAAVQLLISGAALQLLARALGLELSLITTVWVTAAVYAAVMLPISIVGVGVREFTLLSALALVGVPVQLTVALALLLFSDPIINAMIGGCLQMRASLLMTRNPA